MARLGYGHGGGVRKGSSIVDRAAICDRAGIVEPAGEYDFSRLVIPETNKAGYAHS